MKEKQYWNIYKTQVVFYEDINKASEKEKNVNDMSHIFEEIFLIVHNLLDIISYNRVIFI